MGGLPPGSTLPGEVDLASRFGVAVGTVRRALSALVAEGLLTRRPRIGTVVTGRSPEHSLRFFFQYFRLHGADGALLRSRTVTLSVREEAGSLADAVALHLPAAVPLLRIARLRLVEDRPVMRDELRIPAARIPGFPRSVAAMPELVYRHPLDSHGIRITAVRETLRAELATPEDRWLLALPDPAALLVIEATAFDPSGAPCLLTTQRAWTEAHRYVNEVS